MLRQNAVFCYGLSMKLLVKICHLFQSPTRGVPPPFLDMKFYGGICRTFQGSVLCSVCNSLYCITTLLTPLSITLLKASGPPSLQCIHLNSLAQQISHLFATFSSGYYSLFKADTQAPKLNWQTKYAQLSYACKTFSTDTEGDKN